MGWNTMNNGRCRILIVDDEPANIRLLEGALRGDYEICSALDGFDAVRQIKARMPDLILLDVMMPDINGFDVCRTIKSDEVFSAIPVIFLTAMDTFEGAVEGFEAGGIDFLTKPVNLDLLKLRVNNHLELKRQNDLIREQRDLLARQKQELEAANETISRLAATDELTKLANRRSFNDCLAAALSSARRHEYPLSMIMVDLDHFKLVNDTMGHSEGDRVLKAFADLLRDKIRAEDVAARWGGEEFIVILPYTDCAAAAALAERVRGACEVLSGVMHGLSASFGVAQLQNGDDDDSLIRRADDALYRAKREGRNRVAIS
jgi:diguanylate cyclase (GGDEF)-like protein